MSTSADHDDLGALVGAEFDRLADHLDGSAAGAWDMPSLCEGWRVREVVAHMTMAVRYAPAEFLAELEACKGDFTVLSNRVAARDATLPASTLLANLRDDAMHRWTPPGGGAIGALTHVVIHSLDVTVPLAIARPVPDEAVLVVLDHLTAGGGCANFGFDLDGLRLEATDSGWAYGSGTVLTAPAAILALHICGRRNFSGSLA